MRLSKWLGVIVAGLAVSSASAEDFNVVTEIRGGITMSGLELYPWDPHHVLNVVTPVLGSFDAGNIDSVQFQALFWAPDVGAFDWLGSIRPEIGGVINLRGRESVIHAGLNWQIPVGDMFYLEAEGGVALHNGALSGAAPPLRNLGCPVLLHWSYGVGANLGENWTVTANFQHVSNIVFGCTPNDGLNHAGISLGYKF
jgi:hypothetical protein